MGRRSLGDVGLECSHFWKTGESCETAVLKKITNEKAAVLVAAGCKNAFFFFLHFYSTKVTSRYNTVYSIQIHFMGRDI